VRSAGVLPRVGTKLLEVLATVDPSVGHTEKKKAWWEDESVIYVTAEGLARRQAEFRELMEVKIPANFKAVGKAADFGDLSENAEFTSALEEQNLLTERAARMKEELDKARILSSDNVELAYVGLGTRVRVLDADSGNELVFSILGPWDGMPDTGVLSYLSPLGREFLGKKRGEEFIADLPGGQKKYEVLEISSYFESVGHDPAATPPST